MNYTLNEHYGLCREPMRLFVLLNYTVDGTHPHAVVCDCFCSCNSAQMNMLICVCLSAYLWERNSRDSRVIKLGLVQSAPRAQSELTASAAVCDDSLPFHSTDTVSPSVMVCVPIRAANASAAAKRMDSASPHRSLTTDVTQLLLVMWRCSQWLFSPGLCFRRILTFLEMLQCVQLHLQICYKGTFLSLTVCYYLITSFYSLTEMQNNNM